MSFGFEPEHCTPKLLYGGLAVLVLVVGAMLLIQSGIHDWMHPHYSGQVSGMHNTGYGLVLDLDGKYPNQKMTVWIPTRSLKDFYEGVSAVRQDFDKTYNPVLPQVGEKLLIYGPVTEYKARPEIVVNNVAKQMKWDGDDSDHEQ
jgi:hypothetical protein